MRARRCDGRYLETEVWRSLADEPEWRVDVDLHDDVECLVGGRVQHLVECEACVVDDVVNFSPFPA